MGALVNLKSVPTLVESPFIIATIGGVTFGSYSAKGYGSGVMVQYPNYMESLEAVKVNGTVNTYTVTFVYKVAPGDDPNLMDKILSKAAEDRKIILKYGDWNAPQYIYKEEVCIITNVTSQLDMAASTIKYVVNCTSDAIGLASMQYNFPAREDKPSDVLKELLKSPRYGLNTVFSGMTSNVESLIASNDKKVQLVAQNNVTPIAYMKYLVDSMISYSSTGKSGIQDSIYMLSIHDDRSDNYRGTYFKVTEVSANTKVFNDVNTYELDVNYPDDNLITQFSLSNDQSWAILYKFAEETNQEKYVYKLDDQGRLVTERIPNLVKSATNGFSAAKSSWWTRMTQFPIQATITIKGLTRPSILMSYVKVNVWFAGGQKHVSSGLYIITKQVDSVSSQGYKTTLSLLRVGGD